jgi:LacI family gluconate utilization system Gnt-I transcriptional repressor
LDSRRRKPRGRPVRVEDVARVAGVSPITVSRALSSPHKVRFETRERVAAAVASTGYVVNSIASTLRSGRSAIVTVFVASLQNPHFAAAVQGIIDAFEGSRYRLMFAQTGWSEEVSDDLVQTVLPFRPAGLVFSGVGCDEATRKTLTELEVPVIEMGVRANPMDMLVQMPSFEAGRLMGEHLGAQGFARIAFCGHTLGHGVARLKGFHAGLSTFGIAPSMILPIEGTQSVGDGVVSLGRVLSDLPDCDAIFFGSDLLAMGALIEARRRHLDIPARLAIAGYGDLDFAGFLEPPLTTVRISDHEMGRVAGDMLRRRLDHEAVDQPVVQIPVRLVPRQSTGR